MVTMLSDLSHKFTQKELEEKVFVEFDDKGEIQAFDFSSLHFPYILRRPDNNSARLYDMSATCWLTMNIRGYNS